MDQSKYAIISDYEQILAGKKQKFSNYYFTESPERNSDIVVSLLKYFFDNIMQWDIDTVEKNLSMKLLKDYNLSALVKKRVILDPYGIKSFHLVNGEMIDSDLRKLMKLMYKDEYKADITKLTLTTYEEVLDGKISKFPKFFFSDADEGELKACICLQYALKLTPQLYSINMMYKAFANKNIMILLKKFRLELVCASRFEYPIDFLHAALPSSLKDNDLYKLYKNMSVDLSTIKMCPTD